MDDDTSGKHPAERVPEVPPESAVEHFDQLPDDLDATGLVGPMVFPDIAKRRIAGTIYLVVAVGCVAQWAQSGNTGLFAASVLFICIGVYHFVAGWHLRINETDALAIASRAVGFPVGHASAQLAWYGLRSRPAWRILLYSADAPPSMRGLVECDGVDGSVMGEYTEANPEDWSQFGLG
ncbi:MAG: hypothetical protein EXQ69_06755 [Acidimicrobiia bacterium]|nr:hypothetical protein [Acidimicrobiia bacterium]